MIVPYGSAHRRTRGWLLTLTSLLVLTGSPRLLAQEKPAEPVVAKVPDVFIDIDLSGPAKTFGGREEIGSGTTVRVTLRHLLPGRIYHVERQLMPPIRPLEWPKAPPAPQNVEPCPDLSRLLDQLGDPAQTPDEQTFAIGLAAANRIACNYDEVNARLADANAQSVKTFDLTFAAPGLEDGAQLRLTVHRLGRDGTSERAWHRRYYVGTTNQWTQSLGLTLFENQDRRWFLEPVAGEHNQHELIRDRSSRDIDYSPVYFFTWSPAEWNSSAPGQWFWGVSGGLGFDGEDPIPLVGGTVGLAKNLSVVGGVGALKALRLRGEYKRTPRPILTTALTEDQLHDKTYRPTFFLAVSYRFGNSAPPINVEPKAVAATAVDPSEAQTEDKDGSDSGPEVELTNPGAGDEIEPGGNLAVTFKVPVKVEGDWFRIACRNEDGVDERKPSATEVEATNDELFEIDPATNLPAASECTLTVVAERVEDLEGTAMESDFTTDFTVGAASP